MSSRVGSVREGVGSRGASSGAGRPAQGKAESKSLFCWRLIRHSVRDAITSVLQSDQTASILTHGIQHARSIAHSEPITQILFSIKTQEYYATDGKYMHCYHADGRTKAKLPLDEHFSNFLYASHINLYVGWNVNDTRLHLLSSSFEMASTTPAPGRLLAVVYNEHLSEVLTLSPASLTCWVFRYGGRYLLPRKTITNGLDEGDSYSLMVLEQTPSYSQRIYLAGGSSVAIFNMYEGKMIKRKTNLHVRRITAMLFFNPLKYLITAAKDGSIKVWDNQWHLQLVFVGHEGAVSHLALYPYGPMVMSASKDHTIRVWSLETCDEVDKVETEHSLEGLDSFHNESQFCSHSKFTSDLWSICSIHHLHTTIGYCITRMKATTQPYYTTRVLLLCRDSSMRLLNPFTGDIITTLLMSVSLKLVDATYAIAEETIFAVFDDGNLIQASSVRNPCRIMKTWRYANEGSWCRCLLIYEYVTNTRAASNYNMEAVGSSGAKTIIRRNRTLLIGGRKDGQICVINWDTGKPDFIIEAHGSKGVLQLTANTTNNHLISSGLDNVIMVWRVFPYADECLLPLMSFYCAYTPVYMTVSRHKLAVAFQEHSSAIYNLVLYDLATKARFDHSPMQDHMDSITGLACCPKMRLLATCSHDNTVRIWSDANNLLRELRLNATPHSIAFCSERGDLLVAIGKHVHKIDYKTYMPSNYLFRMATMTFREEEEDKMIPYSESEMQFISKEDMKRLKAARSSYKFTHFVDILTVSEDKEINIEKELRENEFSMLAAREDELRKIRDGIIVVRQKFRSTTNTKREAFDNYMNKFIRRSSIQMPYDDGDMLSEMQELFDMRQEEVDAAAAFHPEPPPTGFFPPLPSTPSLRSFQTSGGGGFVPNSVLIKLLWPADVLEIQKQLKYAPPQMTEEQLRQIAELQEETTRKHAVKPARRRVKSVGFGEQEPRFYNYDEEDEEIDPSETLEGSASEFMGRMMESLRKTPPTVEEEDEEEVGVKSTKADSPPVDKMADMKKKLSVMSTASRSLPPPLTPRRLRSLMLPEETLEEEEQPSSRLSSRLSSQRSSPLPAADFQLPGFITDCIGKEWFDSYFPDCNEQTMPKPWTVSAFASQLCKALASQASYEHCSSIVTALRHLHEQHGLLNLTDIYSAIYTAMLPASGPLPSCRRSAERRFIEEAIRLVQALGVHDEQFCSHLMVQYVRGDKQVGDTVMEAFDRSHLVDPSRSFARELDDWRSVNPDDGADCLALLIECRDWLNEWKNKYKVHLADSLGRFRAGSKAGKSLKRRKSTRPRSKSPLQDIEKRHVSSMPVSGKGSASRLGESDADILENVSCMESINYFCEIEMERIQKEEMLKLAPQMRDKVMKEKEDNLRRNTVLVLPRTDEHQSLMRLGLSHKSRCVAVRETTLSNRVKLPEIGRGWLTAPGDLHGFPSVVALPMHRLYLDPFGGGGGQKPQSLLLMLRMAQKYFLPQQSYVTGHTE